MAAYASVAETDSYFSSRQDAVHWRTLTESVKSDALERATRILDETFDWSGEPSEAGQTLRWPRKDVCDLDGMPLDPAAIPGRIRIAAMEQALFLTDPAGVHSGAFSGSGIKSASAGGMSISFESRDRERILAPAIQSIVRGLGALRSPAGAPAKCGQLFRG